MDIEAGSKDESSYARRLDQIGQIGGIVNKAAEALTRLTVKRVTLEEKIIGRYFQDMIAAYGRILALLANGNEESDHVYSQLTELNAEVNSVLDDLLKIINYNLNYLEQYFEFDYASKLKEKSRFVERLNEIQRQLDRH